MSTNLEQQARALIRADNFINGQWLAAASGRRFAVTDPATGKQIADVADSGPADAR
ncbi:succinate-semialdehyde dehydrogenase (NADP(+)), partial [Paraburkholderia dipogonis]